MHHAKKMIVEDSFVTLGSVNFDGRSFDVINDEANVNVLDRGVAAQALRLFD
jgi:cardiolipin synthase